ncbi:MAG: tetratricopeptide repeat protein [Phycisphaerae bacterium]|nr:tetratricopeptide repeat protein [Phycisphaerae bacterium]
MRRSVWLPLACTVLAVSLAGCRTRVGVGQQSDAADHFLAGQLYVDGGNLELALEELSRAVEINPNMALAYSKMAGIYKTRGQMNEACQSYEKAVQLDPKSLRDLVELGGVYQALNRLADAVRVYVRAIALQPTDYQAHFELGTLYFRLNRLAEAEQAFQKCIELDGSRPDAMAHLGVVYDAQGRYYDACRAYRESLERNLDQPKVLLNLATTYLKQGRFRAAVDVLKLAQKGNENDPQVHQNLGACYYQLALETARKPDDKEKQPVIESVLKLLELSRQSYLKAMSLDRNDAKTLAGLGAAQMVLARNTTNAVRRETLRAEAVEFWHHSLELQPNQPDVAALLKEYAPAKSAVDVTRP